VFRNTVYAFLFLFFQLHAGEQLKLTAEEKMFLQKHPLIVLGAGEDWDPYIIKKNGHIVGHDHDVLQLVNKYTGANFVLRTGDWAHMQNLAKNGEIDGLSSLIETSKRKKWLIFSNSYTRVHKAIYIKQNSSFQIKDKKDLAHRVIVIEKDNVADKKLVESLNMKIIYADTLKECFRMLLEGKAEATIGTSSTPYLLGKFGFPSLKKAYDLYPDILLRFAVRKDLSPAVEILNKGLARIPKEKYEALGKKWFSNYDNSAKVDLSNAQYDYLHEKKEIKICVNPNRMPFEHINKKGEYEGILADYVTLFSKKLQIPFVLEKTENYPQSLMYLKKGYCDIIVGETATKKVKETFLTYPYLNISMAFATHADASIVHDFAQIANSGGIGVLRNSPAHIFLSEKYKYIKLVSCDTIEKGLQKVASKKLIAFVSTLPSLVYSLQQQGFSNIKIAGTLPEQIQLSMLINRKSDALLPILNQVINTVTEEEKQNILNKWVQVKYMQGFDYKLLYQLLAAFALLLFFFALRHYNTLQMKQKLEKMHHTLKIQMDREIEKNRQQQLLMLQQNRLAQKGEVLNMIAHQWRQPLNTLSLVNQKLIRSYKKGRMDDKDIESFEQRSQQLIGQMSEIINDFREFFKPEKKKVEFEIQSTIEHTISMMEPILGTYHIEVVFEAESNIVCQGFPNEFGQAIINIVTNAKDAIIERKISDPKITVKLWKAQQNIHVSICDNAGGIPPDILSRIFDPYFSTKNEKNGTGLGLYMCKLIIENHFGGYLNVENTHEGACFNIVI